MRTPDTWENLCVHLKERFGMDVDLNGVLLLVGIRERELPLQEFTKEEKLNLISLGSCVLYQEMGLVDQVGTDRDGWPVFVQKSMAPDISEEQKIKTLQSCALRYFSKIL